MCDFVEKGIGLNQLREKILQDKHRIEELYQQNDVLIVQKNDLNQRLTNLTPRLARLEKKHEYQQQLSDLQDELLWAQRDSIKDHIATRREEMEGFQQRSYSAPRRANADHARNCHLSNNSNKIFKIN